MVRMLQKLIQQEQHTMTFVTENLKGGGEGEEGEAAGSSG